MSDHGLQSTVSDARHEYIGGVYAKALLNAAVHSGNAEGVLFELESLIEEVWDKLPRLEVMLSSPRVPLDEKLVMLDKAFAGRVSSMVLTFLKVICRHGRMDCLRAIRNAARKQFNEVTGRVAVQVRTAEPMSDEVRARVTERLSAALGRSVQLTADTDAELLGGIVVRVGDTVYDASVANRLRRLREEANWKTAQAIKQSRPRFETTGEEHS
jgi:F-type H+-transporting ATPase subunit delta